MVISTPLSPTSERSHQRAFSPGFTLMVTFLEAPELPPPSSSLQTPLKKSNGSKNNPILNEINLVFS